MQFFPLCFTCINNFIYNLIMSVALRRTLYYKKEKISGILEQCQKWMYDFFKGTGMA